MKMSLTWNKVVFAESLNHAELSIDFKISKESIDNSNIKKHLKVYSVSKEDSCKIHVQDKLHSKILYSTDRDALARCFKASNYDLSVWLLKLKTEKERKRIQDDLDKYNQKLADYRPESRTSQVSQSNKSGSGMGLYDDFDNDRESSRRKRGNSRVA